MGSLHGVQSGKRKIHEFADAGRDKSTALHGLPHCTVLLDKEDGMSLCRQMACCNAAHGPGTDNKDIISHLTRTPQSPASR